MASRTEKLIAIAEHYGWTPQCMVTIEECSELIKAICKYQRKFGYTEMERMDAFDLDKEERAAILDEIADVRIMTEQLTYLLKAGNEVAEIMDGKIDRQIERARREISDFPREGEL